MVFQSCAFRWVPSYTSFLMAQFIAWPCLKVSTSMVVSSCIDFPLMLPRCRGEAGCCCPPLLAGGRGVPSIFLQQWEPDPFSEMNGKWLKGETSNEVLTVC